MIDYQLFGGPAVYRIRIQGVLESHWADSLCGLEITVDYQSDPPESVLHGTLTDQAALLGVLTALYDMGFNMLSVEYENRK